MLLWGTELLFYMGFVRLSFVPFLLSPSHILVLTVFCLSPLTSISHDAVLLSQCPQHPAAAQSPCHSRFSTSVAHILGPVPLHWQCLSPRRWNGIANCHMEASSLVLVHRWRKFNGDMVAMWSSHHTHVTSSLFHQLSLLNSLDEFIMFIRNRCSLMFHLTSHFLHHVTRVVKTGTLAPLPSHYTI